MKKEIEKLARADYAIKIERLSDGEYHITVPELSGCYATGDTIEEALEQIKYAKLDWIHAAVTRGVPIPRPLPPSCEKQYSGQTLLRMPKHLHRQLSEAANEEGISLNQYMVYLLAEGITRSTTAKQLVKENYRQLTPQWKSNNQPVNNLFNHEYSGVLDKAIKKKQSKFTGEFSYDIEKIA